MCTWTKCAFVKFSVFNLKFSVLKSCHTRQWNKLGGCVLTRFLHCHLYFSRSKRFHKLMQHFKRFYFSETIKDCFCKKKRKPNSRQCSLNLMTNCKHFQLTICINNFKYMKVFNVLIAPTCIRYFYSRQTCLVIRRSSTSFLACLRSTCADSSHEIAAKRIEMVICNSYPMFHHRLVPPLLFSGELSAVRSIELMCKLRSTNFCGCCCETGWTCCKQKVMF